MQASLGVYVLPPRSPEFSRRVLFFCTGIELRANMSDLSYAVGEVCDMGCKYTFPERVAEFARTHPDSEAFVFRQMKGKTVLHY